jgi:hypothetical protein
MGEQTFMIIKERPNEEVIFKSLGDGLYSLTTLKVPIDESNFYYYKDGKFYKNV